MIRDRLKTIAMAVAVIGVAMLGGAKPAAADILMTISAGGSTQSYDFANNDQAVEVASIGHYSLNIETVVTNYPGDSLSGGISTTVNVTGLSGAPQTLTVQVQLVNPNNSDNLLWTGPTTNPVNVTAGTTFSPQSGITGGTVTTNTYYNSTNSSITTGLGASTISANQTYNGVGGSPGLNSVVMANPAGSYTLSQTLTLTGLTMSSSTPFNFGGTSSVLAPEPSSLAVAGLGALGMIGYGLRRRKALGA